MTESNATGEGLDLGAVRAALREELRSRGHGVASDTLGLRRDLYLIGKGDLARALFEFSDSAESAMYAMYQGQWMPNMPPRFAVIPDRERGADQLEMLEQIRVIPLFFGMAEDGVTFDDLDELLAEHVGPSLG
ncbi:MAG TPA: hypothetical protein VFG89_10915 [Coriobacteriia bacterium]|nr:hypothetical protein [Coriobacteriia bacterium]